MIIKLYSGDACPACKELKKRLVKLELTDYTECDTANYDIKTELMALGLRSIPVLAVYNNNGVMMDTMVGNIASDEHLKEFFA